MKIIWPDFKNNRQQVLTAAILVGGAFWILLTAILWPQTTGGRIPAPRQGFLAPEFQAQTLDQASVSLQSFQGHPVIVNIWATWCGPCQSEMPALQAIYARYHPQGLEILAVNSTVQDDVQAVRSFVSTKGLTFPVLLDLDGAISHLYQVQALPTTLFIDRQGMVTNLTVGGPMTGPFLDTMVQDLLQGGK